MGKFIEKQGVKYFQRNDGEIFLVDHLKIACEVLQLLNTDGLTILNKVEKSNPKQEYLYPIRDNDLRAILEISDDFAKRKHLSIYSWWNSLDNSQVDLVKNIATRVQNSGKL